MNLGVQHPIQILIELSFSRRVTFFLYFKKLFNNPKLLNNHSSIYLILMLTLLKRLKIELIWIKMFYQQFRLTLFFNVANSWVPGMQYDILISKFLTFIYIYIYIAINNKWSIVSTIDNDGPGHRFLFYKYGPEPLHCSTAD